MYWLTHYWPRTYITVGVAAFVLAALLMPVAILLLRRLRMLDNVSPEKLHKTPVPRGGGIVMFGAFAVAAVLPGYRSTEFNGVMIGAFICMAVGAVDDFYNGGIRGVWKLATLVVVTLILERFGVRLDIFEWAPLDIFLTIVWIVGVTSAFNGIDNMDGLASGIAAIVAVVYLFIAVQAWLVVRTETSLAWFGMLAAALIGANAGFLIYNFKPARIFMGDSGSFFLGFTLAALGVMGEWTPNRLISCSIPVIVLGVPLFDFAYILIARIMRGETKSLRSIIDHCGMDHLSHRLTWMGFSQRQAVLFIYLICVALGVSGVLVRNSVNYLDATLGILQGLSVFAIVVILMAVANSRHKRQIRPVEHVPFEPEKLKKGA
ncbi:MAG TPA: MraY family glycosyltransferase [Candidatus Bathyarchaeia archaeon]|nr:MraY family glycosyltransferase [Candidatus Bathyarchaeia archaeon]